MLLAKNIKYSEVSSLQSNFIGYDRPARDRILLQLGYHDQVQRDICHLSCEWIKQSGQNIIDLDDKFILYLETNIKSRKYLNTRNELLNLLIRLQKDKLAVVFESSDRQQLDGFVFIGEQPELKEVLYQYFSVEKIYRQFENNPAVTLPKGTELSSDIVINISELGKFIEDQPTGGARLLNIDLGNGSYLYLPDRLLGQVHLLARAKIRDCLINKNLEFLSYLAGSLKMELSQLRKQLQDPSDSSFWLLFNKAYPRARKEYDKKQTGEKLEIDLQIAVQINHYYLAYQDQLFQQQQTNNHQVNRLMRALENKLSKDHLLVTEKMFDAYYQKVVTQNFKSSELLSWLDQIKKDSLKNDLEQEKKYQILIIGNNPDSGKNFVLHKTRLFSLFKDHLKQTGALLEQEILDRLLNLLLYSSCDLTALQANSFANLEQYRQQISRQLEEADPFLLEIFKRPRLIFGALMDQQISPERKQQLLELFFVENSAQLLPQDDILNLKLPELLKKAYQMSHENGKRMIPWWRRVYLILTKKKAYMFEEISAIAKDPRRNQKKPKVRYESYQKHEHNIRPDYQKLSDPPTTHGKKLTPRPKEPPKPVNLDDAVEEFKKYSQKIYDDPFR